MGIDSDALGAADYNWEKDLRAGTQEADGTSEGNPGGERSRRPDSAGGKP